jgi:hypothetical protein
MRSLWLIADPAGRGVAQPVERDAEVECASVISLDKLILKSVDY